MGWCVVGLADRVLVGVRGKLFTARAVGIPALRRFGIAALQRFGLTAFR